MSRASSDKPRCRFSEQPATAAELDHINVLLRGVTLSGKMLRATNLNRFEFGLQDYFKTERSAP
jgi:hypothetical protein